MLDNDSLEFGDLTLRELGLEIDQNNYIVDQDTGNLLMFKDKKIKYNTDMVFRLNKDEISYDPLNNSRLMNHLFSYYASKLADEDSVYIGSYFNIPIKESDKSIMKVKTDTNIIKSEPYFNESVRIMDVICKINDSGTDVSKYDFKPFNNKKNGDSIWN